MILLDTTVLSNFARAGRLDLLRLALPEMIAHGYRSPIRSLPPLHPAGPVPAPAKDEPPV